MNEQYYQLLDKVMQQGMKGIEHIQWMLKTVHDFSREDPFFDESVLAPLVVLYACSVDDAQQFLEDIGYDKKKSREVLACLREREKKEKKYVASKIVLDLSVVWECSRLGKRMSGKSIDELHTLLDEHTFFVKKLEHEALIQLKQRELD